MNTSLGSAWRVLGKPRPPFYIKDATGAARVLSIDYSSEGLVFRLYYPNTNKEKCVNSDHLITVITVD